MVNRKSDIGVVRNELVACNLQVPVYLLEYENYYELNFTSEYEEWELDKAILQCFPEYQFVSDHERGRKEVRIQVSRYQSEFSTDGWGRPLESPLNETKYLVKISKDMPAHFSPEVKVLFANEVRNYYVNIVDGINRNTDEKGFLLLNQFKSKNEMDEVEILKDRLYKTPAEAFRWGIDKMKDVVSQDFHEYKGKQKKEKHTQEKLPRKLIRDFINSCNRADHKGILKDLASDVVFEKRVNWQPVARFEGIIELEGYIKSSDQEMCSQDFKIRSTWNFDPFGAVTIGVKHYPLGLNEEERRNSVMKYRQLVFKFKEGEIVSITEER